MPRPVSIPSFSRMALQFLRMGAIGYGGPIALVALMEQEICGRLRWISRAEFTQAFVYCKLFPGPVAYQMAVWMGYRLRGRWGGFVAGGCFLLPAFVLILLISIFYQSLQLNQSMMPAMKGLRAGAMVLILQSLLGLFKPYQSVPRAWALIVISGVLMYFFPRYEPLIVIGMGIVEILRAKMSFGLRMIFPWPILFQLFWIHFKAGAFVFGTGFAIIPFLEAHVVSRLHWLTGPEFLDGIAFGQITPGPVTITSVFIGYRVASFVGAVVALVGMYLPGLIMILWILPKLLKHLEGRAWLTQFQEGAIPAVIGCLSGAAVVLGRFSLDSPKTGFIFLVTSIACFFLKLPGWVVIPLGGLLGYVANA